LHAALATAETLSDLLAELGLGADTIEDDAAAQGALERRHIAILAYNPSLSQETVAALVRFVKLGGKVLVCYQLPPRLGDAIGFGRPKYVRPERPDQFAEIRFDAIDIPGLPRSVRQNSWNITDAEPTAPDARVIGRWFDPQGKPAGHAAMLLSDRGAFFSHILLSDDRPGKKQLLAAIVGRFMPSLWERMAQSEKAALGSVGHCTGMGDLAKYVRASRNSEAAERLEAARATWAVAEQKMHRQAYSQAIQRFRETRDLLAEAYLRAAPSRAREGRAFWNHSGTGAYPGDWDRTAKELAANGFNMILPNMLWGGLAHYPSQILPHSATFREHGDQIAQCVAAARKHGLEVHVWKVNHNLSNAPREFVAKLRREARTQVSVHGEPIDWLCPSHPENFKLERESMLEVARKYDVDGLHFDYIRYPDEDSCYCDGCRARFEAASGRKVDQWPGDCYRGPRTQEYRAWRCTQITRLVQAVSAGARKIRPKIKISAAVFGAYPACRESVGQDWVRWVKAGYLDFVCPMDYTESDFAFIALVSNQIQLVGGRVPIYPGIGATATRAALSPDRVAGQIYHARELGAAGFTIFNLDHDTISTIAPAVGLGYGKEKALPPHDSSP
jgi:uncharacterized lipoprotein YddW (UPF0748 family)